tara:strand:+ start:1242 stop:1544 length:303 start_codon:yes stop_codon:yes gene_type:complete
MKFIVAIAIMFFLFVVLSDAKAYEKDLEGCGGSGSIIGSLHERGYTLRFSGFNLDNLGSLSIWLRGEDWVALVTYAPPNEAPLSCINKAGHGDQWNEITQ